MMLADLVQLLFVCAYGGCVGSLINVLVYRLPRGLSVITPPSRCPACTTRLSWRDNIPVFGWLLLRGKCRYCKARISPEYPLVELFVAVLFGVFFALWYLVPDHASWLGVVWGDIKPEWAQNGLVRTWPELVVLLTLLGALVAMTIVDAKTYTIPLELTWIPAVLALVVLPLHAALTGPLRHTAVGTEWTLATPGATGLGLALGGILGLGIGMALLHFKLIRRSFEDYDEWEKKALAERAGAEGDAETDPGDRDPADNDPQLWIDYPHARREMLKEIVFLSPCIAFGVLGAALLQNQAPATPLWLDVLGGVLLGYLVGGGVVWGIRLFGSLAFGKEAMGLGDVHLLAAVGACLGWKDAVIAFFGASFVGAAWGIAGSLVGGKLKRALPFGPYLAVSTVLVLLTKPWIEAGLSRLFRTAIDLP